MTTLHGELGQAGTAGVKRGHAKWEAADRHQVPVAVKCTHVLDVK